MRKDTISQALDLLGERHIAYVTDKKQRAVVMTSLREARPAPDPGIFRRILNTAAVLVFTAGVIIGFILMRQSIGPGTTPGDSLTDTTDTEETTAPDTTETEPDTTDTEPIDTEPIDTETQEPDTTDNEPVETLPPETDNPETEKTVYEYEIILRHKDDTGPEYQSTLQELNVAVTQYKDENGTVHSDLEVSTYFDRPIFEVKDCDYAFDAEKIFEKAKEYDVPLMYEDRPIEEFVLADYQYFTSVYPDEFSSIDLFSINGIAEVMAEIGGETNYPFTPMIYFGPSKINESTEKTLYISCIIPDPMIETEKYETTRRRMYVEFAVDRKTMTATEISRYSYDEYHALYPLWWIYYKNCVAVENGDYKVFYDDRGDLLLTDKKTGKTTVICDILSYMDYEEYCAGEGVTEEESRKFLYQGIEDVSIWNGRYIFFKLIERWDPEHWMVYDIVKGEYMSTNYGEVTGVSDERMFVAFEGENELGLDPGIYYVDYRNSYGNFKYVRIDSISDVYLNYGDDNIQFLQYRCSNDGRFLVMCVDLRPWIDRVYEDIYVMDLKKNELSKYYFCSENGRSVRISDENELIVTNSGYSMESMPISYLDAYIYVLDLDG